MKSFVNLRGCPGTLHVVEHKMEDETEMHKECTFGALCKVCLVSSSPHNCQIMRDVTDVHKECAFRSVSKNCVLTLQLSQSARDIKGFVTADGE